MMQLSCPLTGAIVAQVIRVHAVNDVRNSPLGRLGGELREELVLAVKTAIGSVLNVVRVLKLIGRNVFVAEAVSGGELFRIALVRLGNGRRIRSDCDGAITKDFVRGPSEVCGIRTTGIGHDHTFESAQIFKQRGLLRVEHTLSIRVLL
jgi:hypothetical protein